MTLDEVYRERVYNWIDQLPMGFYKEFDEKDRSQTRFKEFKQIIKDAIIADPMCGLEFLNGEKGIQMVDTNIDNTINGHPYINFNQK